MHVPRARALALATAALACAIAPARADRPRASRDPIASLARALPAGWQLVRAADTITIRHRAPVRLAGYHLMNAHTGNVPVRAPVDAPTITLALRYHVEPRWSPTRYAAARAANRRVHAELVQLRDHYRIDDIHTSKGLPLPATDDERKRLAAYQAAESNTRRTLQPLPRCTLGGLALFDEGTYDQLDLMVDPPGAMREAFAIVELVKRRCTP